MVFSLVDLSYYDGKTLCSLQSGDPGLGRSPDVCVKCKLSAGMCTLDLKNPSSICENWSTTSWGQLSEVPQRCQAEVCEERKNPALVVEHSRPLGLDGFCIYQLGIIIRDWLNC